MGRSQEAEVRSALAAAMLQGPCPCLPLQSDGVDIHVPAPPGAALVYPATGAISPLHHAFVFWAGPTGGPVPDLVADLAERGILRRTVVEDEQHREVPDQPPPGRVAQPSRMWFRRRPPGVRWASRLCLTLKSDRFLTTADPRPRIVE